MPIPCLLKIVATALEAHIPTILNIDERTKAFIFNRGLNSLIATVSTGAEQDALTTQIQNPISERRIKAAVLVARRQQITDALDCLRDGDSDADSTLSNSKAQASLAGHLKLWFANI